MELLIGHFLAESCAEHDKHVKLSRGALERLKNYSWPGNVRQLRLVLKRAVLLSTTGHEWPDWWTAASRQAGTR